MANTSCLTKTISCWICILARKIYRLSASTGSERRRYCNWLSKEEDVPEEQWCYEIKGNEIKLKADYLSLSGYRLPTEAEMEYVTRAGAATARYYGETEDLLPMYAWYSKNAQEKIWPVGGKKPNDLGLFDAQGNVFTWCQERYLSYPEENNGEVIADKEDISPINGENSRVLRGGSFLYPASNVRSAYRNSIAPTFRNYSFGFRLARTLLLNSFTALPLPPKAVGN